MTSFEAFLGKMSPEVLNDLSDLHGTVWDEDHSVPLCRRCGVEFSLLVRRHHCRECGGIYCDGCAPPGSISLAEIREKSTEGGAGGRWYPGKYIGRKMASGSETDSTPSIAEETPDDGKWYPGKFLGRKKPTENRESSSLPHDSTSLTRETSSDTESQLICIGCRYGESPGIQTRGMLKNLYKEYRQNNLEATILPPSRSYTLSYGSLYGEGEKSERCLRRVDGQPAHSAGYFEVLNKSDYITAIRVCDGGSESLREHCRPSYFALLPQQCLYFTFNPSIKFLEVAVLYGNPSRIPPNTPLNSLIYNTRGTDVTKEMISPQCLVSNFTEISLYTVPCEGRNVILKYQGQGLLELRKLTTTKLNKKGAIGMITSMLSSSSSASSPPSPSSLSSSTTTRDGNPPPMTRAPSVMDFATNAVEISRDMTSSLLK